MKKVILIFFSFIFLSNLNLLSYENNNPYFDDETSKDLIETLSPDSNIIIGTFESDIETIIEAIIYAMDTIIPNLPVIFNLKTMEIKSNFFEYKGRISGILFFKHNWIEKSRFIVNISNNDFNIYNIVFSIKTYEKSRPKHITWYEVNNSQIALIYLKELAKITNKKLKGDKDAK